MQVCWVFFCRNTCIHEAVFICMYTYVYVYAYRMNTNLCISNQYTYVRIFIYAYINVYVYIHVYTYFLCAGVFNLFWKLARTQLRECTYLHTCINILV